MHPFRLLSLAWRNLWRNRRRTLITLSMVAFGFALSVVAIGLGDGGHNQMVASAIRMGEGHLTIQPAGYLATPGNGRYLADGLGLAGHPALADLPGQVAPRIFLQALVSTAYNSLGAGLQGLDPARDPLGEVLRPHLVAGQWLEASDRLGVLVGRKMAEKLKVQVGSKIVLMVGGDDGTVESRLGRVRGIFASKLEQLDAYLVLAPLGLAQPLLPQAGGRRGPGAVTRLAIFLDDPDQTAAWRDRLRAAALPEGVVLDWQEMMPQVVNFVIVDDLFNYIWLAFILVMVAFGIVNTILMSALERTREFGLLRALGMRAGQVRLLMLTETVLLALLAMGLGWVLGGGLHLYLATTGLDLSAIYPDGVETAGMYMDPVLHASLSAGRVAALSGIVFGTTLLSGLYPAFKAARIAPVAALRT